MITTNDIRELFAPQLARITSEELRSKVTKVWVEGCRQGGYESLEELRAIPFTLLTETHGIDLVEHTRAVTDGAVGLARAQNDNYRVMPYRVDMDRLVAGGLLHDVGKLLEIEPDGKGGYRKSFNGRCTRHPVSGAILAAAAGLPVDVVNTIAAHAKEGDGRPRVLETVLIHQADFATFDPLVMMSKGDLIVNEKGTAALERK